ncbi:MAG: rod shape-determining protein MreD [Gammaproteobacteria bacterium RIFCSPHIGHO2_12_FULL_43_28]|nr:MAG: rod shape-determining protein MreD [Gammaproteobacteria bacterium RIFCSPHIGHO2_12_FULL_43_28]
MPGWLTIITTLIIALILTLLPMPHWTIWLRPAWVLMVLIFWSMTTPYRVGVGTAWIMGLLVDLLSGTVLGEHALAFSLIVYFVNKMHIRLKMAPFLQQGLSVLLFMLCYQFVIFCIQGFIGQLPDTKLYWMSTLTSTLLWPWLYVLLRDCRRRFRVV